MSQDLQTYFSNPPEGFTGEIRFNEPLARYTYYQIGGPASVLAVPKSRADLEWVWNGVRRTGSRVFFLGAGSNILISDQGFSGVVIRLTRLQTDLEVQDEKLLAGGGAMISVLLRRAGQEGWGGLEFLAGIPGTVGGAVRMNAGTHLGETQSRLTQVTALLLGDQVEVKIYESEGLRFEYRKNHFLPEHAVVWTTQWQSTDRIRLRSKSESTKLWPDESKLSPSIIQAAEASSRIPKSPGFRPGRYSTSWAFGATRSGAPKSRRSTVTSSSIMAAPRPAT